MSNNVKYWSVKRNSKTEEGVLKNVAHFTLEDEATTFASSDFFSSIYGGSGVVECIHHPIFDTAAAAEASATSKLQESGLSKLNDKEKKALGLENFNNKTELEIIP